MKIGWNWCHITPHLLTRTCRTKLSIVVEAYSVVVIWCGWSLKVEQEVNFQSDVNHMSSSIFSWKSFDLDGCNPVCDWMSIGGLLFPFKSCMVMQYGKSLRQWGVCMHWYSMQYLCIGEGNQLAIYDAEIAGIVNVIFVQCFATCLRLCWRRARASDFMSIQNRSLSAESSWMTLIFRYLIVPLSDKGWATEASHIYWQRNWSNTVGMFRGYMETEPETSTQTIKAWNN